MPNLVNGNLNSANLKFDLPYSYNYNNSIYRGEGDTKYVKFNRLWANVLHSTQATSSTEDAYVFEVQSKVSGLDNAAKNYPITVTPSLKHSITGATLTPCTIADASKDSCTNTISLPKNMFVPGTQLLVTFTTSANSLDAKNAIVSDYLLGLTVRIHNQAELVEAFKGDTSGKVFALENDIALTGSWTPVAELKNATFDGQGYKITNLNVNNTSNSNTGFFRLTQDVTIKNLNLQGEVNTTNSNGTGLLVGRSNGKLTLLNSNFNSKVKGISYVGGVIGSIYESINIESVTVISDVEAQNYTGGVIGYTEFMTTLKNIRINSKVNGKERAGGISGSLYKSESYIAENIIVDAEITVASGGSQIGGIFAATRGLRMSNIDATVNITGGNATRVGGLVGNLSWEADKDKLSNVIVRGVISTSVNPTASDNRISGIASTNTKSEINKAIDMTTIAYTNGTITTNYVSPLTTVSLNNYVNSGNVFYVLPAGATYITAANPAWVAALTGDTAATQKTLETKGFDFTNTWTIKKDGANNDIIGIKEDSIPQFPQW